MSTTTRSGSSKRKKLPACDYCKAHRVLCHPQIVGPCPRCEEKGVDCRTTPVTRRKRRTKAELVQSKASSNSFSNDAASPSLSSSTNTPGSAQFIEPILSCGESSSMVIMHPQDILEPMNLDEPTPVPPTLQMSSEIIEEFMQMPRNAPYDSHPIRTNPFISLSHLKTKLQAHSWDLCSLTPQERVLTHCLLTLLALHSTNPSVIGPGEVSVEGRQIFFTVLPLKTPVVPDLREYGFRRERVVRQLWAESLWLANQEGVATNTSKENAASCWILGYLRHIILGKGASAYSAAYVYHMRTLAEEGKLSTASDEMLKFRGQMIGDTIPALMAGKNIPLTLNDEYLIVPHKPDSLEHLIDKFTTRTCTTSEIFHSIHTFTHNIIRLSRETVDNLSGAYARSQPLDECFLTKHFASLDIFHSFLSATLRQINLQLVPGRSTPQVMYYLRVCSYGLSSSWGSLILVLFELLRDRSLHNTARVDNLDDGNCGNLSSGISAEMSIRRLCVHLHHARKLVSRTVVELTATTRDTPSIARLIPPKDLARWARFLLAEENIVDITRAQCTQALECIRDVFKLLGFSYADRTGIIEAIDERLASYAVDNMLTQLRQQDDVWLHDSTGYPIGNTNSDWLGLEVGL
ncbi:hypothetical protein FB446DRAFT_790480 [Lentinula raphanica]|nr:hypothetical protein FB446DRAFT_790480 [Lentinula raphanica]